ncbi:hypothetical protein N7466_007783 [Penicillium verhagenii]|uniref:uncharacterized protein n=1 Tax=Penicillium verhagenii TaxID=1562060 RepID=UPI0025459598|nr:uncharacterized protein N7466_007783 [Penicillium verhagenii]KAJ5928827.1 hypothetical protein N7466_007783 [Penicillium verhagenii]
MAYTQNDLIRSYIDDVVPHTLEAIVEHMWLNILSFYFPSTRRFGIEREASISPRSEQRANVCLTKLPQRLLANDPAPKRVTVIMIENKCCPITSRHPAASLSPPPPSQPNAPSSSRPRETTWRSAKIQLTNYMINVRNTQHVEYPYDLYGIVGIGHQGAKKHII